VRGVPYAINITAVREALLIILSFRERKPQCR
jgi:hypothetical protein